MKSQESNLSGQVKRDSEYLNWLSQPSFSEVFYPTRIRAVHQHEIEESHRKKGGTSFLCLQPTDPEDLFVFVSQRPYNNAFLPQQFLSFLPTSVLVLRQQDKVERASSSPFHYAPQNSYIIKKQFLPFNLRTKTQILTQRLIRDLRQKKDIGKA